MACLPVRNDRGKRIGVVCGFEPVYDYGGHLFEVHNYMGPIPLRRDNHKVKVRIPPAFWLAWERFEKLPLEERDKFRVER
jgi:hypothetical protein